MKFTEEKIELMSDSLTSFLSKAQDTSIVCFDTETNGVMVTNSVLSVSAIYLELDAKNKKIYEVDRFNRFYYCEEPETPQAIAVNGLTEDRISELRKGTRYPKLFKDDPAFEEFCKGVSLYMGHNLSFDLKYTPFIREPIVFDTMHTNTNIVQASWNSYRGEWKYPKLLETAKFYGIEVREDRLHESMYDVELTVDIARKMLDLSSIRIPKRLIEVIPV